jgi:hypothetical protein
MDYCGVEFTAVETAEGCSWKWHLLIVNKDSFANELANSTPRA